MADDDFATVDSGASNTYPIQCSALRKNGLVMIKGNPCKIVEMSTSKTGKHGHAKVHLVGIHLFTSKKFEDICPSTHNMDVPNVTRKDYEVCDLTPDGFLTLMGESGETREDLKLPDNDLGREIAAKFVNGETIGVSVLKALEDEEIVSSKVLTS
ncbi:eukaryotic translation initiation factor 5A-2 [Labrus bergylta]|uniref:Eukaryotic translation initiation factor 5A n=1 Tax=Labrus bergylta TaxID=56723 RepID=A0A3Q3G7X1_9LABR|nr:eukaryotic translation initiation factor 5A-1-like [Labrus bergylta]